MKKLLLSLLMFVTPLLSQTALDDVPDRLNYVASLNGQNQYFSKTSPSKMDLNGEELLLNPTLNAGVTNWSVGGNGTLTHSTDTLRSGAGAGRIVANGSARSYAVSSVRANTTTDKFTCEFWCYVPASNISKTVSVLITDQVLVTIGSSGEKTLTGDTWTKISVTVQTPGTQTHIRAYIGFGGPVPTAGDVFFFDDASLTQAWDFLVVADIKPSVSGSFNEIFSVYNGTPRYELRKSNAEKLQSIVADGVVTPTAQSAGNITTGVWTRVASTLNRTENATNYISGSSDGGAPLTTVGKLPTWSVADIGVHLADPSRYWSGQIGEVLVVRYSSLPSNVASWVAYASTQRFIPEPPGGGTTVLRLFGRRNDAYDQSGNQGVLTNTGSTPIIAK